MSIFDPGSKNRARGGKAEALSLAFPPILGQLIPRLRSPFDGEVVATVRAIERTLKAQKLDWHDVASAVAQAAPPTQWDYEPQRTESAAAAEVRAWLEVISREPWPNDWTSSFIANILTRQSLDSLSAKQRTCANSIITEAYRRGVRVDRGAA
jgi:hypothetical protein